MLVTLTPTARGGAGRKAVDRSPILNEIKAAVDGGADRKTTAYLIAENEPKSFSGGQESWRKQGLTVVSKRNADGTFNHYALLWIEAEDRKEYKPRAKATDATPAETTPPVQFPVDGPDENPEDEFPI